MAEEKVKDKVVASPAFEAEAPIEVNVPKKVIQDSDIKQAKPSIPVEGEIPNTIKDRVVTIHEVCPKCGSPSCMIIDSKAVDNLYKALSTAKPVVFRIPFRLHLASNPEAEEVILPKPHPISERKKFFKSALKAYKKGLAPPSAPLPASQDEPQP